MASTVSRGQVIFQDENAQLHGKKAVAIGKTKTSVAAPKKNGAGLGGRKALNDITNKSKLQRQTRPQASTKKKIVEDDFDMSKEGFSHDHSKCIEEQQNQLDSYFSDLVLYGLDTSNKDEMTDCKPKLMDDMDEPEEIPMAEFSDWFEHSTMSCSPLHCNSSLSSSPLSRHFEAVEFKLKEDKDDLCP